MGQEPKTPEEALAAIKQAAASGDVEFASTDKAELYEPEIDEIMTVVYEVLGRKNKGRYLITDRSRIEDMLSWDDLEVCKQQADFVVAKLGVSGDSIVEMAEKLRALRSHQ